MRFAILGLGCCVMAGSSALWACGEDAAGMSESGSSEGLPPTLEHDALLSELSAEQVGDLCSALDAELSQSVSEDDAERLSCTLLALFTSSVPGAGEQPEFDQAACERSVADCVGSGLDGTSETECDEARVRTASGGCSTTVGEYFECLQAGVERLALALDSFSCETLADPDVAAMAFGNDPMDVSSEPACAAIQAECPALLGAGSGGTPPPAANGCDDTCEDADDGFCDDGGAGSNFGFCGLGTDCADCGPR